MTATVLPTVLLLLASLLLSIYGSKFAISRAKGLENEQALLSFALPDLETFRNATKAQKQLLCVTFTRPENRVTSILKNNVHAMRSRCDWAIIFYNGTDDQISKICRDPVLVHHVVHCKRNELTKVSRSVPSFTNKSETVPIPVPKTVLYQDLLPLLPRYNRVFTLDDDVSLKGFDAAKFLLHWDCAMQPPPLITQPLISESNQYIGFVNKNAWDGVMGSDGRKVLVSQVGFIEQQAPVFDSAFFDWFIRRVLTKSKEVALKYGVDWGGDRAWCGAAQAYAARALGYPAEFIPCAVLPNSSPVHHYNHHSMDVKRKNRETFRVNAAEVVAFYTYNFPTWTMQGDPAKVANPLFENRTREFLRSTELDKRCVAKRRPGLWEIWEM